MAVNTESELWLIASVKQGYTGVELSWKESNECRIRRIRIKSTAQPVHLVSSGTVDFTLLNTCLHLCIIQQKIKERLGISLVTRKPMKFLMYYIII